MNSTSTVDTVRDDADAEALLTLHRIEDRLGRRFPDNVRRAVLNRIESACYDYRCMVVMTRH